MGCRVPPSRGAPDLVPGKIRMAKTAPTKADSSANLGFESRGGGIWLTADKLRNNMAAAEYKHVVLGLIFLKYISDTNRSGRS